MVASAALGLCLADAWGAVQMSAQSAAKPRTAGAAVSTDEPATATVSSTAPPATANAPSRASCRSRISTSRARPNILTRREDDSEAARRHDAAGRRRRPDEAAIEALRRRSKREWTRVGGCEPNPGWRPFQRLSRVEYERAVKELLDLDVDVTAFLPPDTHEPGLRQPRRHAEFLAGVAARLPARRQPDQPSRHRRSSRLRRRRRPIACRPPRIADAHVPGAPFGSRGGAAFVHTFPADGTLHIPR